MRAMTTPNLAFISHEGLKSERQDLAHRLSNWTKPVIGVRDMEHLKDHHQYTLDTISRLKLTRNWHRRFIVRLAHSKSVEEKSILL
jgi:hypothetical protein